MQRLSNRNPFSIFDSGKLVLTATIKKRLLPKADYSDHLLEVGITGKKAEKQFMGIPQVKDWTKCKFQGSNMPGYCIGIPYS